MQQQKGVCVQNFEGDMGAVHKSNIFGNMDAMHKEEFVINMCSNKKEFVKEWLNFEMCNWRNITFSLLRK